MTAFIHAEIPLWDGLAFHVDGNSKITVDNGSYAEPRPNAFSLPHIATCPGSTPRCRASCYVNGLKKHAPDVYRTYELNEMALHSILPSEAQRRLAALTLAGWINDHARGGFRWHVSGDVFSAAYAEWIVEVCQRARQVPFWIYTRSLQYARHLKCAPNLALNLSADKHNYDRAVSLATTIGARICYLVSEPGEQLPELPDGSVIFPDYPLRGRSLPIATEAPWWQRLTQEQRRMTCMADYRGQSEQFRCGPCKKCLLPTNV